MKSVIVTADILRRTASRMGLYAFVEIVLPGGTLLALLLYLYRRQRGRRNFAG